MCSFVIFAGVGVAVIIVVCVGFLVFMIVLGVIRIRSAHNRTQEVRDVEEKQEMEWDNSALTITVNPMDQEGGSLVGVNTPLCRGGDTVDLKGQQMIVVLV